MVVHGLPTLVLLVPMRMFINFIISGLAFVDSWALPFTAGFPSPPVGVDGIVGIPNSVLKVIKGLQGGFPIQTHLFQQEKGMCAI